MKWIVKIEGSQVDIAPLIYGYDCSSSACFWVSDDAAFSCEVS